MVKWRHRNFHGWRIGGLRLLSSHYYPKGRTITLASYHHPKRMCWLWFLELFATRKIIPRIVRLPGDQARTYIELPFFTISFCWQDQGRYTDPSDERMRKLAGVADWPTKLSKERNGWRLSHGRRRQTHDR